MPIEPAGSSAPPARAAALLGVLSDTYDRLQSQTDALRCAVDEDDDQRMDDLLAQREQALEDAGAALDALQQEAGDAGRWQDFASRDSVRTELARLVARLDALRELDAGVVEALFRQRGALLEQVSRLREGRLQLQAYAGVGRAATATHVDRRR